MKKLSLFSFLSILFKVSFATSNPISCSVAITPFNINCNGACTGGASASVSGGTAPYTYNWTPTVGSGQGTSTVGNLCAGTYTVSVTDASGCNTSGIVTITQPPALTCSVTTTQASCSSCNDGKADCTASGGTPSYLYQWSPAPPAGQGTTQITWLTPGTYTCCITDQNGCTTCCSGLVSYPTGVISVYRDDEILISPNPFGNSLKIETPASLKNVEFVIYNIVGEIIISQKISDKSILLNTDEFRSGVYFISIRWDNNILVKKLFRE